MNYSPNLRDPRVLKNIKSAYQLVRGMLSNKPRQLSQSLIDKHFGFHGRPLGKYLRDITLVCVNDHYDKDNGVCKEYILNETGMTYLRDVLKGNTSKRYDEWVDLRRTPELHLSSAELQLDSLFDRKIVSESFTHDYKTELATAQFTYMDKSNRLWHPLQQVRREFKKTILADADLIHQYDIKCCAPTLLLQHAQSLGYDEYPFALMRYINNRTEVRTELASLINVHPDIIKQLINAMFCGAKLGNNKEFALSKLLDHDAERIKILQDNAFIQELKMNIKHMWQAIEPSMIKITATDKNKKQRKVPLSSKLKWNRYFELERITLNAVRQYLIDTDNKFFLEHDGWTTSNKINEDSLREYVRESTGFTIKLDYVNMNVRESVRDDVFDENNDNLRRTPELLLSSAELQLPSLNISGNLIIRQDASKFLHYTQKNYIIKHTLSSH